jgi:NitT/TauT family transport system substrate-binding protein
MKGKSVAQRNRLPQEENKGALAPGQRVRRGGRRLTYALEPTGISMHFGDARSLTDASIRVRCPAAYRPSQSARRTIPFLQKAAILRKIRSFVMPHQPPRTHWVPTIATALATGLLLTSCTGSSQSSAGQLEKTTITVDAFEAVDSAGLFIAQQEGFFARQGLNVKLHLVNSSQPMVDDVIDGKADVVSTDYVTDIENETSGDPDRQNKLPNLRIIAEASFLRPNVLALVVPQHSKTTSVASLKGKRIAILEPKNISAILVNSLLEANGIPLEDVHFKYVQFPDVGTAFQHNDIDAAFVPEPFVTLLEENYGAQELADLDEGATTDFPVMGLEVSQSWAEQNPNTLRAFVTAFNQGQLTASIDRAKVESVLEKYLKLPPVVASVISLPSFPQGVNPVRLQRTIDAMVTFGMLSSKFSNLNIKSMIYNG